MPIILLASFLTPTFWFQHHAAIKQPHESPPKKRMETSDICVRLLLQ